MFEALCLSLNGVVGKNLNVEDDDEHSELEIGTRLV